MVGVAHLQRVVVKPLVVVFPPIEQPQLDLLDPPRRHDHSLAQPVVRSQRPQPVAQLEPARRRRRAEVPTDAL